MKTKMFIFYKKYLSRFLKASFGSGCRFEPSCSEYCHQALRKYGVFRGGFMSLGRLIKCNPFGGFGWDPV